MIYLSQKKGVVYVEKNVAIHNVSVTKKYLLEQKKTNLTIQSTL